MVLLPCAYDIYYDYAVLLLISLSLNALINATCAGTRTLTFDVGLIQLSFIPVCSPDTCNINFQSNCANGLYFSAFH